MFRPIKFQFNAIKSDPNKIESAGAALRLQREKLQQQGIYKSEMSPIEDSSISEDKQIIKAVRINLLSLLRKYRHIAIEQEPRYYYPGDLSGRLSKLDSIVGNFLATQPSLLNLQNGDGNDGVVAYSQILQQLNHLLCPIKEFPPLKKSLRDAIEHAIAHIIKVINMRFFPASELQDSISALIHMSQTLDPEVLVKLISPHYKIINALINDKKIMSTLPEKLSTAIYLSATTPQENKPPLVIDEPSCVSPRIRI